MKKLKRISIFLITALIVLLDSGRAVLADTTNYVVDGNSRQPVPDCYICTETINNIGSYEDKNKFFKQPQDLFIDNDDNIYVVDTGWKRIVKLNSDHVVTAIFTCPGKAFNKPQGIYVDDDGDMFVADTENNRIVHLAPDGSFVEEFLSPVSDLETGSVFTPTKLIVSQTGYIYVANNENIMSIDGNGEFRGYYGQTNIGFSLSDMLNRMFNSEEKQLFAKKRTASSYINLTYDGEGYIYATSNEREEGEIKKLNAIGTNVYRKYKTIGNKMRNPIKDWINNKVLKAVVAGKSFKFGEYFNDEGMYIEPKFVDICVDDEGIVTVIEGLNGKVFQYDQAGRLLVAFGGLGEQKGTFTNPSAIDVDSKGRIYVLDQITANIQVFEPTEFIQNIHAATSKYNDGDYQASYELWRKVLATDENYDLAHTGIANTYYKQGFYRESMEEAKIVGDRAVYTLAFDEYKYIVLREHFLPIILLALIIIVTVIILVKLFLNMANKGYWDFIRDKNKKMSIPRGIAYTFYIIFHPFDALEGLKNNRTRINWAVPIIIFGAAYIVRMAYLYVVHFPLASIEIDDIHPAIELVKLLAIPISWIPASFMATSISGGESKMKEITFASAASLAPYIVINIPLMFLSHIMSQTQKSWYGIFTALAYVGMFLILFISLMVLNNYTFGKTLGMMFVTIFLIAVLWLVILLCYVLTGRMIQFVISILNEFTLNFL